MIFTWLSDRRVKGTFDGSGIKLCLYAYCDIILSGRTQKESTAGSQLVINAATAGVHDCVPEGLVDKLGSYVKVSAFFFYAIHL